MTTATSRKKNTEIEAARRRGVPHYHLGFWIEGAATMAYKADYGPHEVLLSDRWTPRAEGTGDD